MTRDLPARPVDPRCHFPIPYVSEPPGIAATRCGYRDGHLTEIGPKPL